MEEKFAGAAEKVNVKEVVSHAEIASDYTFIKYAAAIGGFIIVTGIIIYGGSHLINKCSEFSENTINTNSIGNTLSGTTAIDGNEALKGFDLNPVTMDVDTSQLNDTIIVTDSAQRDELINTMGEYCSEDAINTLKEIVKGGSDS